MKAYPKVLIPYLQLEGTDMAQQARLVLGTRLVCARLQEWPITDQRHIKQAPEALQNWHLGALKPQTTGAVRTTAAVLQSADVLWRFCC